MCEFIRKHYENFFNEHGYIPIMFNPYNETEITDVCPLITTNCDLATSSAAVLILEGEIKNELYSRLQK